jgi:hypothetical protein
VYWVRTLVRMRQVWEIWALLTLPAAVGTALTGRRQEPGHRTPTSRRGGWLGHFSGCLFGRLVRRDHDAGGG